MDVLSGWRIPPSDADSLKAKTRDIIDELLREPPTWIPARLSAKPKHPG